ARQPPTRKTFVTPGPLPSLTRDAARELVESLGGRVTSSVTRKTHYVVVGEAPGSKAEEARRPGGPDRAGPARWRLHRPGDRVVGAGGPVCTGALELAHAPDVGASGSGRRR